MKNETIKKKLGPCGLNCEKCFAFSSGEIQQLSKELKNYLGSFEIYAKRFVTLLNEPVFEKYPHFKEVLDYFSEGKCKGCRSEDCKLFTGCRVKECIKARNIDFCFLCNNFPCEETGFDENLKKRWIKINNRMKEIGVLNYYEEIKDLPRY